MGILVRYISLEIVKLFCIVLLSAVGLYLCVDFMEKIDDFLEAGASVGNAFVYFIYKTPFIVTQIIPVGVLIAVLITFGIMSKHNEITALRGTGVSTAALLRPTLVFSLSIALVLFFFTEVLAPFATARANRIWMTEVKKEQVGAIRNKNIWLKRDRVILNFQYYDHASQSAMGLSFNQFDTRFRLVHRIDADSGRYDGQKWILRQVVEQRWRADKNRYDVKVDDHALVDLGIIPEDLKSVARESSEMNGVDLYRHIRKIEAEGYDATRYWVDLHAKAAFAFACLVMGVIGLGVALSGRLREGLVVSVIYGIGIVFIYWVFFSFCLSLGYGSILPPFAAAWLANMAFGCLGLFFLSYAR